MPGFSISAHLFSALRQVMREKDYGAPEAGSERCAPFYEIHIGHCITPEQRKNRWAKMSRHIMRETLCPKIALMPFSSQLWASFLRKTRHDIEEMIVYNSVAGYY
jgi:hypothetical protein